MSFSIIPRTGCICILAILAAAAPVRAGDFTNGDFELGSFAGWTQSGGYWYGGLDYPADYVFGSEPFQSAIVTSGYVPCLLSRDVSVSEVCSGSYSARINSNDSYDAVADFHFSQIQQTASNWDAPYFSFDWSAVLQDSGHPHSERPHFMVILQDATSNSNLYNLVYYSDNLPASMVQRTGQDSGDWSYTGWQHVQLNTPASISGHDLTVTILASDCAEGGHDGALYVDNIMGAPRTGYALPVAVAALRPAHAPAGASITLDGSASWNSNHFALDLYDWDFDGDGVTDLSGGATQAWTVPSAWSPGTYTVNLRVREPLPAPLPAQWSPWMSVPLTVVGPADPAHSVVTPALATILADGRSTQLLTVQARDAYDQDLAAGGETVQILQQSGNGTLSNTSDNGDGTYTATVTSPRTRGCATFTASMNSAQVGTAVAAELSEVKYVFPPFLKAAPTPTNAVVVSWSSADSGWHLETATNLPAGGAGWMECSYQTSGTNCWRVEPLMSGRQHLYRLKLP